MFMMEKLGLLRSSQTNPLYIDHRTANIYALRGSAGGTQFHSIGSLLAFLKTLSIYRFRDERFMEAMNCAIQIRQFKFCLTELIPYLKFLDKGSEIFLSEPPVLQEEFADLMRHATNLISFQDFPIAEMTMPIEQVRKMFNAPCAIALGMVIPLMPATDTFCLKPHYLTVGEKIYQPNLDQIRPLSQIIEEIENILIDATKDRDMVNRRKGLVSAVIEGVDKIIRFFRPIDLGYAKSIYQDSFHQLQYKNGNFILVRGPFKTRRDPLPRNYITLHISGNTRREWLTQKPFYITGKLQNLWGPQKPHPLNGICMGSPVQYAILHSSLFTDVEALVQWLDAGVIVSTERHKIHQNRVNPRLRELLERRARIINSAHNIRGRP